jgi:hypothetical protein
MKITKMTKNSQQRFGFLKPKNSALVEVAEPKSKKQKRLLLHINGKIIDLQRIHLEKPGLNNYLVQYF